jgi:hypothetical protein
MTKQMHIVSQPLGDSGSFDSSYAPKLVLHTTEGLTYPGPHIYHNTHPHITADVKRRTMYVHCPLDRAAFALKIYQVE